MTQQPIGSFVSAYETEQRGIELENRNASAALWTGIGSVLCLLLTAFLASLRREGTANKTSVVLMAVMLILSVLLFFAVSKRDERWFFVCALINHAGIGLAVCMLLEILGLQIRLQQMAMSGLPAAAVLFGVVMFYSGMEGENRKRMMHYGLAALAILFLACTVMYFREQREFWLCAAVCALLCCASFGAAVWANGAPEQRSVLKALAVVSFSVYLILLAAAAVALFVAANSSSGSSSRSSRNNSKRERGGLIGLFRGTGVGAGTRSGAGVYRGFRPYGYSRIWFYPMFIDTTDRTAGMTEAERQAYLEKRRRGRRIALGVVFGIVAAFVVIAVVFGRG